MATEDWLPKGRRETGKWRVGEFRRGSSSWGDGPWRYGGRTYSEAEMCRELDLEPTRLHECIRLLDEVGADRVEYFDKVRIVLYEAGIVPAGVQVSLEWTEDNSEPVCDSLDKYWERRKRSPTDSERICRLRLEGDWYIRYEWW